MKSNKISKNRLALFYIGSAIMVVGGILFALPFITIPLSLINDNFDKAYTFIPVALGLAFVGFFLMIIGSSIRSLGKYGAAGSGVILDPEQAREDLRPHSKAAGGIIGDALEEVDIFKKEAKTVVKIRCKECGTLNEEDATFCKGCGSKL